jgi:6-phosphogluconolactonase
VQPALASNAHVAVITAGGDSVAVLSSYGEGGLNILRINPETGGLDEPVEGTEMRHVGGSEAHPTRQSAPHPHSNFVDPSGSRVLVSDLGQDKIYSYAVDAAAGTLSKHRVVETAPAAGPRHMVFHPSGEFVYGINELDSTINAYRYLTAPANLYNKLTRKI